MEREAHHIPQHREDHENVPEFLTADQKPHYSLGTKRQKNPRIGALNRPSKDKHPKGQ